MRTPAHEAGLREAMHAGGCTSGLFSGISAGRQNDGLWTPARRFGSGRGGRHDEDDVAVDAHRN